MFLCYNTIMKRWMFGCVILCYIFIISISLVEAGVVINEVAWMGTINSANDEWIELHNTGSFAVDLSGWFMLSVDDTPTIELSGILPPNGYYLLERTDDTSVPLESADLIYVGALSNMGESLTLYDNNKNSIDILNFSDGWPAGDTITKETMQRSRGTWVTAVGTPKKQNKQGSSVSTNSKKKKLTVVDVSVVVEKIMFDGGVVLKNESSNDIDLSGWTLYNGTILFSFPENMSISNGARITIPGHLTGFSNKDEIIYLQNPSYQIISSYQKPIETFVIPPIVSVAPSIQHTVPSTKISDNKKLEFSILETENGDDNFSTGPEIQSTSIITLGDDTSGNKKYNVIIVFILFLFAAVVVTFWIQNKKTFLLEEHKSKNHNSFNSDNEYEILE